MSLALTPFAIVAVIIGVIAIPFLIGVVLYNVLRFVFFIVARIIALVGGVVLDALRFVGHVIGAALHVPLMALNALFLRGADVRKHGGGFGREITGIVRNAWSAVILRPLRFLGFIELRPSDPLSGQLADVESNRAMPAALADDMHFDELGVAEAHKAKGKPDRFDGYRIIGTLPRGGSGARLFIAQPKGDKAAKIARSRGEALDKVVIKSFSMEEGSTMPQIVRESRALEAARDLGLVIEHKLEKSRFFYVMPYVAGEDLATVTRDLHHDSGASGLNARSLRAALSYFSELLVTVERFHQRGLWHKDIKPSNVIVSKGRVHLVDLGLVTPLRSAMTLTTHGTEYFRDPEMVRLAMQGVKVHEVDGVKFDLYSAGALLYSMLENSFPAHGSLSRFSKNVPEALQWIVRRSMAEMHQRYAAASDMLGDLQAVLESSNPYMLKPAALPSMQGRRLRLRDWQAGAPGAAYRQHGYRDSHSEGTVFGPGFDERLRDAGSRLNDAGERVYDEMQRVTAKLHKTVSRQTAKIHNKVQKRAQRKHRVRKGPLIAASLLAVFLVLPTLFLGASSSPVGISNSSSGGYVASVQGSNGQFISQTVSYGGSSTPVTKRFPAPAPPEHLDRISGQRTMPQAVSHQHVYEPVEMPQVRYEPISALFNVTPRLELEALRSLVADQRVLLIDDLAGGESSSFRSALRELPVRLMGADGESDIDYIDALAEAKRAIGFAQPDDAGALGYLAEFLETRDDIDAVYWIGHVGGDNDVLGRLVTRR